jgi:HlyD family secretion protein
MTFTKRAIVATLLAVCGLTAASTFAYPGSKTTAADVRKATTVLTDLGQEQVQLPQGARVSGNGIVEPLGSEAKLSFDVPGRIVEITVREGQFVEAGTVLARLDDQAERVALRIAEAEAAVAQAELARIAVGLRREDVDAFVAEADSAKARVLQSEDAFARAKSLSQAGSVTEAELARTRREAERERAQFSAADARRKAATSGARYEDVRVSKARLVSAQARRDQAQVLLEQRTLRAPSAGEVLQCKYRVGERSSPERDPLFVFGNTRSLVVRMDVDERDISHIKVGSSVVITVPAMPGKRILGHVQEVGHRMGRKNVRTDDPVERIDTKMLEVLLALDSSEGLVAGVRVVAYVE